MYRNQKLNVDDDKELYLHIYGNPRTIVWYTSRNEKILKGMLLESY